ncbi:hypothetical protein CAMGR0001_0734 [Campylobacter gracilis RM3268]|uniref:Uncharacterized protein n=1 Tax=Campylobacter gracilis RM3268 TaxID=553220 RepID=C8PFU2_9BACT|nr:hypothetical protein CAMGR0001_0734 [Campylobacter gracilis RM3268]
MPTSAPPLKISAPPHTHRRAATSLSTRRRALFLQTLHRSPSRVVCAAALKFRNAKAG